jgi:cytochrome c oxidase cbb3-type subunit 3
MVDGRGGIGPNLTDEYWILGGGIKNIYNTISEGGRDGKGMIAWKNSLSVEKTQQVSNYVWSLQGSKPAKAKAPEGDKWVE